MLPQIAVLHLYKHKFWVKRQLVGVVEHREMLWSDEHNADDWMFGR